MSMEKDDELKSGKRGKKVKSLREKLLNLGYQLGEQASDRFDEALSQAVKSLQEKAGLDPDGIVTSETMNVIEEELRTKPREGEDGGNERDDGHWVVRGTVQTPDGKPIQHATVKAYDKGIRQERTLGDARTNDKGHYEIIYQPIKNEHVSLLVRAFESGEEIASSQVIAKARREETVDLVKGNEPFLGPSEYTALARKVLPYLEGQGIGLISLTADEAELLAKKLELDLEQLGYLVLAAQLAKDTLTQAELWYACFRQNLPTRLSALLAQDLDTIRQALESALKNNVIPQSFREGIEPFLQRLQELIVEQAFKTPDLEGKFSLHDLFETIGLTRTQQKTLLDRFVRRNGSNGSIEGVWEELRRDSAFGPQRVEAAQNALRVAALTNNHVPLIQELQRDGLASTPRKLAQLTEVAWVRLMKRSRGSDGQIVGTPPDIPGEDEAKKQENYAHVLTAVVEDAFPTAVLTRDLSLDRELTLEGKRDLETFLNNNEEFEIGRVTNIDRHLRDDSINLTGINDTDRLRENVRSLRRLWSLTPRHHRYEVMKPLLERGFTSARRIEAEGNTFVATLAPIIGAERTRTVYAEARHRASMALTVFSQFSPTFHSVLPRAIFPGIRRRTASLDGNGSERPNWYEFFPSDGPDWPELFGRLDFCSCKHCQSVLSPAAYLVDLLAFLRRYGALDGLFRDTSPPLNTLGTRRGDIGTIELSCDNTNIPVPWIDLVLEILERAITPNVIVGVGVDLTYQTTGTAEERRAIPEHRHEPAYTRLRGADYPWNLPFSLSHEEAWRYTEHMGFKRYQIMEAFQHAGPPPSPSREAIAADHLRLSPREHAIIFGGLPIDPPVSIGAFWGLPDTPFPTISQVVTVLRQSGLTYTDLLQLIETRFANRSATIAIEFDPPICDLDRASFTPPLGPRTASDIHRFERLRRKLGWSFYDLDRAITALQPDTLNEAFLVHLSDVLRLQDVFRLPLVEMLSWWSTIDTANYRPEGAEQSTSLYQTLFQNPTVFEQDELEAFRLSNLGNGAPLTGHRQSLLAVLRISASDLDLLTAGIPDELTLATISDLYRTGSLAKALKLPIRQFLTLRALSSVNPFDTPATTRAFMDVVDTVRGAGFTVPLVDFLLRHEEHPSAPVSPSTTIFTSLLTDLRTQLQALREEHRLVDDPTGELLESKLALLLDADTLGQTMALILGGTENFNEDPVTFIETHLPFLDPTEASTELTGPEEALPGRVRYVFERLIPHLHQTLSESLVIRTIAGAFNIAVETAQLLLTELLRSPFDETMRAMDVFINEAFSTSTDALSVDGADLPPEILAHPMGTLMSLWKVATLTSTLKLPSDEVMWLHRRASALGLLEFRDLPIVFDLTAPERFPRLLRLIELVRLRDALPRQEPHLFAVLDVALDFDPAAGDADVTREEFIGQLHEKTGWNRGDLSLLASAGGQGLGLAFPQDYGAGEAVRRLHAAMKVIERVGTSAEEILTMWITPDIEPAGAQSIKAAAKARHDNKQWLRVAQAINDELRERQRDALMAFLIADRSDFRDANDVYAHYLIDPQMSACMLTSRIRQAISAVQLYVQRILLNLEEATLPQDAASEWEWMKLYRVWEANRKIFLWPENWMFPELRDDKSPFFKELESVLLQNTATEDHVEDAVKAYLEKVDRVARLEIAGFFQEENTKTIHFFARTRGVPPEYFYCRWEQARTWTGWERVDLDIEGHHLMPVVYNHRLYLFWAIFSELSEETNPPPEETNPPRGTEIKLAWSEYKRGSWSPKIVSQSSLALPNRLNTENARELSYFRIYAVDPENFIHIWYFKKQTFFSFSWWGALGFFFVRPSQGVVIAKTGVYQGDPYLDNRLTSYMKVAEADNEGLHLPIGAIGQSASVLKYTPGESLISFLSGPFLWFTEGNYMFTEDQDHTFLIQDVGPQLGAAGSEVGGLGSPLDPTHGITPGSVETVLPSYMAMLTSEGSSRSSDLLSPAILGRASDEIERLEGASLSIPGLQPRNPLREDASPVALALRAAPRSTHASLKRRFQFMTFYHPYVNDFIMMLNEKGLSGLLGNLTLQQKTSEPNWFEDLYDPTALVWNTSRRPYPSETVDFEYATPYSIFNWELFLYIPLLVAERLSQNLKFAEAREWLHRVFNPTDCSNGHSPQCYWRVLPLFDYDLTAPENRPIEDLLKLLSEGNPALENQVRVWRANPFNSFPIARLRTIAFQKHVVMKYLDNLIAWADREFTKDTAESVNEAIQLYILAAELLGPRPTEIPPSHAPSPRTFNELAPHLDAFSNALVNIETQLASGNGLSFDHILQPGGDPAIPPALGTTLYFCVPPNDRLLAYWDTVEDRLFKIRHCLNIQGIERQLPLFEPPISPELLVRAVAAGVDISSAINNLHAPLTPYRFLILIQKATELANEVKGLGGGLLAAMEKRDAEALAQLRAGHEVQLLKTVRDTKLQHIEEANEAVFALGEAKRQAEQRASYYSTQRKGSVHDSFIKEEIDEQRHRKQANEKQQQMEMHERMASIFHLIPDLTVGIAAGSTYGGSFMGKAASAFTSHIGAGANNLLAQATQDAILARQTRLWNDWGLNEAQARQEAVHISKQQDGAKIRQAIALQELQTHDKQVLQAEEVYDVLRDKYTNQDLYHWMVSQLSTVYFQAYKLAYDLAKRAEKSFQYEIGPNGDQLFINPAGYWDSLKQGLLSGERLGLDLKRMEFAYLDSNKREYELTKHVSLQSLDPLALLQLKETGECFVTLPEALFDMDCPGHYCRRIKQVSLTVPCVTGPYTPVNCTLTLQSSRIRTRPTPATPYAHQATDGELDDRFQYFFGTVQSMVTSHAQDDAGLFEANMRDDRYLPFEGQGVISTWHLRLNTQFPQFDIQSISDVVAHVRYTAKEGGLALRNAAQESLQALLNDLELAEDRSGLSRFFSARSEFAAEWHRFLHPSPDVVLPRMNLDLSPRRFPFPFHDKGITITQVELFLELRADIAADDAGLGVNLTSSEGSTTPLVFGRNETLFGALLHATTPSGQDLNGEPGTWLLEVQEVGGSLVGEEPGRLNASAVRDMAIVCHYLVASSNP